jgi:hypothetical protein
LRTRAVYHLLPFEDPAEQKTDDNEHNRDLDQSEPGLRAHNRPI